MEEKLKQVDALFAPWDTTHAPGCSLAVIQDGCIIFKNAYGLANLEHRIPNRPESVFYIASTSKQFAAASIALLQEEGLLSVDDDVRKYIPEIPDYGETIRIINLINHSSGLRDFLELHFLSGKLSDELITDEDALEIISRQKELNFKPGDRYLYSNSGYFLLSVIIKRISGKTLRQFAQEKIFMPLGMDHTHYHDDHTEPVFNRSTGYSPKNDHFAIDVPNLETVGSGGIYSTVEDLYLWNENFYHNQIGKADKAFLEELQTPRHFNDGEPMTYAYGLAIQDYKGLKMVGHSGGYGGYSAEFIRFPEKKFTVLCLSNNGSLSAPKLARQVADIFLDEFLEKESAPEVTQDVSAEIALTETELEERSGMYYSPRSERVIQLEIEDDQLYHILSEHRFPLTPLSKDVFRLKDAPIDADFHFEKSKQTGQMKLYVDMKRLEPDEMEKMDVVAPAPEELAQLAGQYYSEELNAIAKLAIEEDKLSLKLGRHKIPLIPARKDMFIAGHYNLYVSRDKDAYPEMLTMCSERVRNIRFLKI
jgi:CubicO group peptidase (beta-lactamase class C family)